MAKNYQINYQREYYQNNKEKIKQRNIKYNNEHKEYKKNYAKEYYLRNRNKVLEKNKQYYYENIERIKDYQYNYYLKNNKEIDVNIDKKMPFDRKDYNFVYRNKNKSYYQNYNKNYQQNNTETVNACNRRYSLLNRKQKKEPIIQFENKKKTIYFE